MSAPMASEIATAEKSKSNQEARNGMSGTSHMESKAPRGAAKKRRYRPSLKPRKSRPTYREGDAAGDALGAGDAATAGAASVLEIASFKGDFLRTCRSVLVNVLDVAATRAGGGGTSCRRASSSRARRRISAAPAAFPRALSQLYA